MKNTTITYIVQFQEGYYAKHQPNYAWNYTNDISKALEYKSFKGALERATGFDWDSNSSKKGIVREKTTISEEVNGTYKTESTFKEYTYSECVAMLKEINDIARDKKLKPILKKEAELDARIDASNKKVLAEKKLFIEKQDAFYAPLFKELQETLNTDYYKEKRDAYVHSKEEIAYDNNIKCSVYSVFSNNDISKFRALYSLMNTVKILLDNGIHFSLHGSDINVPFVIEKRKATAILTEHGVFDEEYCWFGKRKELCFNAV